ncbi:GNAT family N-acetyltransferase [Salininema proteolyticum]|uniref:GNAT family N-acetyltransferase n=1 Tax=Salininema proteolyticum TaxID=1607685 RepID=A0ABV8TUG7_9ACTN
MPVKREADIRIKAEPYANPLAQQLCEEIQDEYRNRYGGDGDQSPIDPDDFDPPQGIFLIAYDTDGEALGCGAWKTVDPETVEFKRIYVREHARRRGLARLIMEDLESTARDAGRSRVILFTGPEQPEAIAMYEAMGYTPIEPFGAYAEYEDTVHVGKAL